MLADFGFTFGFLLSAIWILSFSHVDVNNWLVNWWWWSSSSAASASLLLLLLLSRLSQLLSFVVMCVPTLINWVGSVVHFFPFSFWARVARHFLSFRCLPVNPFYAHSPVSFTETSFPSCRSRRRSAFVVCREIRSIRITEIRWRCECAVLGCFLLLTTSSFALESEVVVCWLLSVPETCYYNMTEVGAKTSHLTQSQYANTESALPGLKLRYQAPGRVATTAPVFKSLV